MADAAEALAKANAEAERQRLLEAAREVQLSQAPVVQVTGEVSGNCLIWMAQAGITDTANAMFILERESGCNPNAWNASSGAGGLAQALPFSKMGCALGDGQCQMNWFRSYVEGRYGTFANAAAFWRAHSWY